jgi:hypothetical protein
VAGIRRLLEGCLTKDREGRLRDVAQARVELEEAQAVSRAQAIAPARSSALRRVRPTVAAATVILAVGVVVWRLTKTGAKPGKPAEAANG